MRDLLRPLRSLPFAIAAAAFLAYGALFVVRSSVEVGGERYFLLEDDPMISMRYARNLAEGAGLRWNAGEAPVEGITNPLWTGIMALPHLAGLPDSKTSLPIEILSGLLLLVAGLAAARLSRRIDGRDSTALATLVLTLFYLPLVGYALKGYEVVAVAALATIALERALAAAEEDRLSAAPYVLLGIGTWIRPDATVLLLAVAAGLAAFDAPRRRAHLTAGAAALALFLGSQTALRLWYYGEVLPNTYYLKMTGYPVVDRVARGTFVLARFVWRANPLVLAIGVLPALPPRARVPRVLLGVVLVQAAYSAWVGGDNWETYGANRFVATVWPVVAVLLASGAAILVDGLAETVRARPGLLRTAAIGTILLLLNAGGLPTRVAQSLPLSPMVSTQTMREWIETARVVRAITDPDASIAVSSAGTVPYLARRPAVDLLGKSDPVIARMDHAASVPKRPRIHNEGSFLEFEPGHNKWDHRYSLTVHRPDVVVDPWVDYEDWPADLRRPYRPIEVGGTPLFVRRDSEAVHATP